MTAPTPRVLLIGYGNPGRLDDGLGPALAEAVEGWRLPNVTVEADYQLTVENSAAAAEHDVVVFADAAVDGAPPFRFHRLSPRAEVSFSSHSLSPAAVLGLAHDLFGASTEGYVLGIRGYAFNEFEQSLSDPARANLAEALRFIGRLLREGGFAEAAAAFRESSATASAPVNEVVS